MPAAKKSASKWKPAPAEVVARFNDVVASIPDIQARKMFGYPAAFVNGNMVGGLFQESMMLRLAPADRATIEKDFGAKPFEPMPGRVMREYVTVPATILDSKPRLRTWIEKAATFTRSLPAKPAGPAKKPAARGRNR